MDFLNSKIKTIYFRYLAASFGSTLISSIYAVVDMAMVGQYHGPDGSAALAVVAPIWNIIYSIGLLVYIVLVVAFAYFYTSITFNPLEIANNMKKQGGFIPGIRPGKPTSDYLSKILNYIVFIGAVALVIVAIVPIFFNGVFGANVSFGGTSIIIIVGVVIETLKQIESQMRVRYYKGFLND